MVNTRDNISQEVTSAVCLIGKVILLSQERAVKTVNQEQQVFYYSIGRFISANTCSNNVIEGISNQLKLELSGLRKFRATNLKNMRLFYEAWCSIENNSSVATDELQSSVYKESPNGIQVVDNDRNAICQLRLTNLENFPISEFFSVSFLHHIAIINNAKDTEERFFYIRHCHSYKPTIENMPTIIEKQDLFHNQGALPKNFMQAIPDYKQAFQAIQMFKDEYLLDFINVEELGMCDEEVDGRVIEQRIVQKVKNFIMTFDKGFTFAGNQVHSDKLGHDYWIGLLFYNLDLRRTVVIELKKGNFKVAYLAQLCSYLCILNDDDCREGENPPVGIILCKKMDKEYVNYIMQDFRQPMSVATYKTADEMEPELIKLLPPKKELMKLMDGGE